MFFSSQISDNLYYCYFNLFLIVFDNSRAFCRLPCLWSGNLSIWHAYCTKPSTKIPLTDYSMECALIYVDFISFHYLNCTFHFYFTLFHSQLFWLFENAFPFFTFHYMQFFFHFLRSCKFYTNSGLIFIHNKIQVYTSSTSCSFRSYASKKEIVSSYLPLHFSISSYNYSFPP